MGSFSGSAAPYLGDSDVEESEERRLGGPQTSEWGRVLAEDPFTIRSSGSTQHEAPKRGGGTLRLSAQDQKGVGPATEVQTCCHRAQPQSKPVCTKDLTNGVPSDVQGSGIRTPLKKTP